MIGYVRKQVTISEKFTKDSVKKLLSLKRIDDAETSNDRLPNESPSEDPSIYYSL